MLHIKFEKKNHVKYLSIIIVSPAVLCAIESDAVRVQTIGV